MAQTGQTQAKKRPGRSLPLAARFSLFVCTLILLVGLTVIVVVHAERQHQTERASRAMIEAFGHTYAPRFSEAIDQADWSRVSRQAEVLAALPGVSGVEVLAPDGRRYGGAKGAAAAKNAETLEFALTSPATGASLGRLRYQASPDPLGLVSRGSPTTAFIGIVALMLLSVPITIVMVRRAMAPLKQLTAFAEKVGAHRLTMQIDIKTGDEFEKLAGAFNHMISRLDSSMRRIQRLAYVDPVTELPNADRLERDLTAAIDAAGASGAPGAIFILQLDKVHRISETLGVEAARDIVAESAVRLTSATRGADPWALTGAAGPAPILARLSTNEFAVLFAALPRGAELRALANALIQPFDESFIWREHRVALTCALGAAFFPRDGRTAEEIMRHARLALNAARETPLRMRFFTRSLDRAATAKLNLEKEMRAALEQNQFRAFFQPKVNLRTGRIVGAEALARWIRPDRSVISPAKFIPAAEEMGLIGPISESIMRDACWKAAAWSREGLAARVAVNVSALQFADEEFPQKVLKILDQAGLPAACLELEITESIAMQDVERATRLIAPLRARGVRFAIDDFGTGHSSLAALTHLPFEVLKIDQTFIRGLKQEGNAGAIVETILAMAASLNYDAIAEGVETEEEAEFLRRRGCPTAQGFLFGAAVAPADYLRLLRQGSIQTARPASAAASA